MREKVIFITGSSGIGAATARLAAKEGARIFVASRTESKCRDLTDEIAREGGTCRYAPADLTRAGDAARAVERCVDVYGRVDGLFNVAGLSARRYGDGPVHTCDEAAWDVTFDANVKSAFLVSREVLRRMLDQDIGADGLRGAILNISSVLWYHPQPDHFATHAYAAAKAAIVGLTRSMAAYYAPHGIRVNVLSPGLTRTPMTVRSQGNPVIVDYMKKKQSLVGDLIDVETVARAALFLLGDDSASITGDVLTVDGGWSLGG